jgi:hypothetical protein
MARPTPARGDAIGSSTNTSSGTQTFDYRLTTTQNLPVPAANASAPQIIAAVPAGTIVPPVQSDGSQGSPLSILNSSSGFDQNQLVVALKDQAANGSSAAEQLFGLSFFGTGLQSSGSLDFALSVNKSLQTPPVLQSQTAGVTIAALQLSTSTPSTVLNPATSTTTVTQAQVPEPISLVLWVALAGVGLWRRQRRV